jgi:hypothetical protein
MEKLDQLLTAVYHHKKMRLIKQKHMHDLIVAAMHDHTRGHRIGRVRG